MSIHEETFLALPFEGLLVCNTRTPSLHRLVLAAMTNDEIIKLENEKRDLVRELCEIDDQLKMHVPRLHFSERRRLKKLIPIFSEKITRINAINDRLDVLLSKEVAITPRQQHKR